MIYSARAVALWMQLQVRQNDPAALISARFGARGRWAGDFAAVGALTGFLAPLPLVGLIGAGFVGAAGAAGALSGAMLGAAIPFALAKLGRMPVGLLMFGGVGVGAAWGSVAGMAGAMAVMPSAWPLGAVVGGVAGALQFGWFWLPYLLRRSKGRKTWPLLVGATVLAPVLGWIGASLVLLLA